MEECVAEEEVDPEEDDLFGVDELTGLSISTISSQSSMTPGPGTWSQGSSRWPPVCTGSWGPGTSARLTAGDKKVHIQILLSNVVVGV